MTTLIPKFKQTATGAVNRPINLKLAETVSVLDFGAVADWNGSTGTDNLVPFQNAYAAIKATGGTLLFPKGSYYCTSLIGSNPNDGADIANNVEFVGETGTNLIFSGAYAGGTCVGLQGDNVAIRNLNINSTRTLNYRAALNPQRTPYQIGIYIGGKQDVSTLDSFYSGAQVTNCTITNMNLPIALYATENAIVQNCTIDMFTDTGIIVDNCTTDIWVLNNKVTRGGDDCFFARHYSTTAYATAGNFIGRFTVSGNIFHDTFGKNAGFGGIGDVIFSNNICSLNWAGGIGLENTWGGQLNANNYQNVLIDGNTFWQPGQNFNTSYSSAAIQVSAPGFQPSGIHTVAAQDSTATYWYNNISITNNKIINPYYGAIALSTVKSVFISGNTFTAGSVNHGSGSVNTTGTCLTVDTASDILTTGNAVSNSLGIDFTYCYNVATGAGPLANIRIEGNIDKFSTGAIVFSDGGAVTATKFNTYDYTTGGSQFNLLPYTYANLPTTTAYTGSMVYCSNGRKVGEGGGAGTGVPVYYANAVWRVLSTDAAVAI